MGDQRAGVLIELLRKMKLIRHAEEQIAAHYGEGKMRCPTHLSIGQEAPAAAAGVVLHKSDQAFSGHRAHAHYIAKGGSLRAMIAEMYGKETGCSRGRGGSMHLVDRTVGFLGSTSIVGNTIPIAVGAALSNTVLGRDAIACVFLGDAAVEEGAFHEAANFAVLRKLPVLLVCENNLYSVYSPLGVRQPPDRKIWKQAASYGLHAEACDGNDVVEAHDLMARTVASIRAGSGPAFLEFATYRWLEHCGPNFDNDLGYRKEAEFLEWKERDPIPRLENRILEENLMTPSGIEELEREIAAVVADAFDFAEKSDFPDPESLARDLYARPEEEAQGSVTCPGI